jgi:hypothetical protein
MYNIISIDELENSKARFMIDILKNPEDYGLSQILVAFFWYSDLYKRDQSIKKLLIDHFGINFNKFKIKGCKKEEK